MLLTPPGSAAIGVIRVEGADAVDAVSQVFQPRGEAPFADTRPEQTRYGLIQTNRETIDDVLVTLEKQPTHATPTRVDIHAHGGVRVLERILTALEDIGVTIQPLDPLRALVAFPANNRIEVEVLAALPKAKSRRAVRLLACQRTRLGGWLEHLLNELGNPAPKHAPPAREPSQADANSEQLVTAAWSELAAARSRFPPARALLDGIQVAIVGPPNSGKSTLLNALSGRTSAVVAHQAGTTRDWVAAETILDGLAVNFIDTAGLHQTTGVLELRAVRHGAERAAAADVRLLVLDGAAPLTESIADAARRLSHPPGITVLLINKQDLPQAWSPDDLPLEKSLSCLPISAAKRSGIDKLKAMILDRTGIVPDVDASICFFTDRQVDLYDGAVSSHPGHPGQRLRTLARNLIGP